MKHGSISAFVIALGITAAMIWGLVYFIRELWPVLPPWLALIVFILLAVAMIGYPIYTLACWSNRYLERHNLTHGQSAVKKDRKDEENL